MRASTSRASTRRSTWPSPRAVSRADAACRPSAMARSARHRRPNPRQRTPTAGLRGRMAGMTLSDATTDLDELTTELDREYVFHSWSAQAGLAPVVIAGGSGTVVWDHAGTRYLDFSSQLVNVNIGHQHPAVIDAIHRQADLLATVGPAAANLTRGEAAKRIVAR